MESEPFILAVVCFDHHIGPEIEFVYPHEEDHTDATQWKDVKEVLPLVSLPTRYEVAAEKTTSTCFYFHIPPTDQPNGWKGVAYYDVIDPHGLHLNEEMKTKYSRGAIQKSVVVLSKIPYQAYVQVKLHAMAQQFFAQSSFGDYSLLVELYESLQKLDVSSLSWSQLHVGLPLQSLIRITDIDIIVLIRLLWIEGRIVFYSESPQQVSSHILAFLSLLPGGYVAAAYSDANKYRWNKYGLPLQLMHSTHTYTIEPYLVSTYAAKTLRQADHGYLVGTCDPMCLKIHDTIDCVVDLDTKQIYFHSERARHSSNIGPSTTELFTNICKNVPCQDDSDQCFEWLGSDGWLRQQVQLFVEEFLTEVVCEKPRSVFSFWPSASNLSTEYDPSWLSLWYGTFNYNQWIKSHRLKAEEKVTPVPESGRTTYTYPNGDMFEGEFKNYKRHGTGKYVVANSGYSYEGEWMEDMRHGRGVLRSIYATYDGNWKENEKCGYGEYTSVHSSYKGVFLKNQFHGHGQLKQNRVEYDGEFEHGRFCGMGKCLYEKHPDWKRYSGEWKDGVFEGLGTLEYVNGDVYVGEFQGGKRHGQGSLTTLSGNIYFGQWKQNYQDGHGSFYSSQSKETKEGMWRRNEMMEGKHQEWVIKYANNDKYIGTCQSGRPWGQGICRYANGSVYTGEWVDGLREGLGIFCDHNGRTFEGEWRNSQPWKEQSITPYEEIPLSDDQTEKVNESPAEGDHVFIYENGDTYSGTFRKGKRHGRGNYTSKLSRHEYDGEWDMDQRHGKGILTSGNGDFIYDGDWIRDTRTGHGTCIIRGSETYGGSWQENQFHGHGVYTDADGNVYEGEFYQGFKHGMGKLTCCEKSIYQGEFKKGEKSGIGTCTYANGDIYTGEWQNNQRHGEGTMMYSNGERYVGQWQYNLKQGCGSLTDAKRNVKEGIWSADSPMNGEWHIKFVSGSSYNGNCVNGKPSGQGVCKYTNGDVYSGEWVNGARSGWGICVFGNGDVFEGEWTNNHVSLNGKGTLKLSNGTIHAYSQ